MSKLKQAVRATGSVIPRTACAAREWSHAAEIPPRNPSTGLYGTWSKTAENSYTLKAHRDCHERVSAKKQRR